MFCLLMEYSGSRDYCHRNGIIGVDRPRILSTVDSSSEGIAATPSDPEVGNLRVEGISKYRTSWSPGARSEGGSSIACRLGSKVRKNREAKFPFRSILLSSDHRG